jgi:ABC-type phosphonate transport system ATPase subunit
VPLVPSTHEPGSTLRARGLTKHYGERAALRSVSFELVTGELAPARRPAGLAARSATGSDAR